MSVFDEETRALATAALDAARARGVMIVTAESCTGGLVAGALTSIAGSSDAVDGGTITYSNEAKVRLGVDAGLIERDGAVSEAVGRALAEAAATAGPPNAASVAVTGVAGPGGGTALKPVGLVHIAASTSGRTLHRELRLGNIGRDAVRRDSVCAALRLLVELLSEPGADHPAR
ncbi:MAG: nicotinamide-nucleotide amidohydrolase family protein [Pseudomonadota bacterium]